MFHLCYFTILNMFLHLLSLNSSDVLLEVHARSLTEEVYVAVGVAGIHVHEKTIAPVLA